MPSLNSKRRASDLLRAAMQARLAKESYVADTVTDAPRGVEGELGTPEVDSEVATITPNGPDSEGGAGSAGYIGPDGHWHEGTKSHSRYLWRCRACIYFARHYRADPELMKAAQTYAYSQRQMICAAFDQGTILELVLNALKVGFEASLCSEGSE